MADETYIPRLKVRFRDELVPTLHEQLGLANVMQVPRPDKVVVNMGRRRARLRQESDQRELFED